MLMPAMIDYMQANLLLRSPVLHMLDALMIISVRYKSIYNSAKCITYARTGNVAPPTQAIGTACK